jgi:transposase-like protein
MRDGMRKNRLSWHKQERLIEHFGLFLKECEWCFNNPNPKGQLKQLKQWAKQNLT